MGVDVLSVGVNVGCTCRDHVEWGAEQQCLAREKVKENSSELIPPDVRG